MDEILKAKLDKLIQAMGVVSGSFEDPSVNDFLVDDAGINKSFIEEVDNVLFDFIVAINASR